MCRYKILIKITGSIAAYKSAYLISKLVQNNCDVIAAASESALKFIGAATLEGLSGNPVYTDSFAQGRMMSHIGLVKWADLTILCPASANTLNKMANGIADNLVTSLFLAHDWSKPYLAAPAMNSLMFDHPATQESMRKLARWGVNLLPVSEGRLACGDSGIGKLLDPDEIFGIIMETLKRKGMGEVKVEEKGKMKGEVKVEEKGKMREEVKAKVKEEMTGEVEEKVKGEEKEEVKGKRRILITSGGAREKIDGVRFIANMSTGKTGSSIARYLWERGHDITFLHARDSIVPGINCMKEKFTSFNDLDGKLKSLFSNAGFDAVIHLAAVSDYSPYAINTGGLETKLPLNGKLGSGPESVSITFRKNHKILEKLKEYSGNRKIKVIGFKLTNGASESERFDAIREMFEWPDIDYIVSNDLTDRTCDGGQTNFNLCNRKMEITNCPSPEILSAELEKIITEII
jgi:phosphopantothenoylcysteine decarboxylase / phosphopantothenate---cysteine ligase